MNVTLIARSTYLEAIRDRVLAGVIAAGVALLLVTLIARPLAMGEGTRVTIDLGLSSITFLGLLVVLMVGTSLVAKEIERRTIFNLLSRPIARPVYLVGKWAGLSAALWTVAAVLGLALWTLLAALGHAGAALSIAEAVYLAGLELTVVTSIAVMFSALSTPVLSSLYTLGLFVVGQWSDDLRRFAADAPAGMRGLFEACANLVPNLSLFNMRSLAASGEATSVLHLGVATGYALLYCACMMALAAAAFESRDFK
ncbi:MAG: ABC transporter permease subunit [Candidatus Eisenbacteria bacterium]|nr:ABC transporter permease subunit [Candidatus Eisenbacteria bacterium]